MNVVLGLGLALSPWVLGYTAESVAAWNAWIVGAAIPLVAIGALVAFTQWEEWANLGPGLWAILAPWALGFVGTAYAVYVHVSVGLIVGVLAAVALWFTHNRPLATA